MFAQPTASPCRMFLSRCIGQINPAELETFHLAYWVIDAGYSALASGFGSYPSRSNGWHSSSKKNISVRRTLSLPAINKANMLSVSWCWMEWFIHTTPLISLFPWEPLRNTINSTFCINISNKDNSAKVGSQVKMIWILMQQSRANKNSSMLPEPGCLWIRGLTADLQGNYLCFKSALLICTW